MYILRYYIKSKYNNYSRQIEKTFNNYLLLVEFIKDNKLKDYEVFIEYKEVENAKTRGNKKV